MKVSHNKKISAHGSSFVEFLVGLLIIGLSIVAILQVRYYSSRNVVDANRRQTAGHLASRIIDTWRNSEDTNFNFATAFGSDYQVTATQPSSPPSGFTWLGSYVVTINQMDYSVNLSYKTQTQNTPTTLNVQVLWPRAGNFEQNLVCSLTSYMNL